MTKRNHKKLQMRPKEKVQQSEKKQKIVAKKINKKHNKSTLVCIVEDCDVMDQDDKTGSQRNEMLQYP